MENIRDPDLRKMVDAFKQDSTTILNYHRLAMGQAVFDQMYGKRLKQEAKEGDEQQVQPLTVLKGCRKLLIKVCQCVIKALDEPQEEASIAGEDPPGEQERDVVDALYTVNAESPSPACRKAPVWDK